MCRVPNTSIELINEWVARICIRKYEMHEHHKHLHANFKLYFNIIWIYLWFISQSANKITGQHLFCTRWNANMAIQSFVWILVKNVLCRWFWGGKSNLLCLWQDIEIRTSCSGAKDGIVINKDCHPVRNSPLLHRSTSMIPLGDQ